MNLEQSLKGKVTLVTGASRGIGRAIAEILGKSGATVIGTATTEAGAQAISDYFTEANIIGSGMMLNVTDDESIARVTKAIVTDYGAISILINNAGITRDNLLIRMKNKEWDDIMITNLTSVFKLSKTCLRGMMKARHGRIISIASVIGATGNAGQANYAAAKAGIVGFSKSLAREIGSRNITVNVVAPGFIDTDMTKALSDDHKNAMVKNIPLGSLGNPEDIANAVLFLVRDASYISGQVIAVDGGRTTFG
jgi:3-oxoacyl-[acyl-carrier protein] reductase